MRTLIYLIILIVGYYLCSVKLIPSVDQPEIVNAILQAIVIVLAVFPFWIHLPHMYIKAIRLFHRDILWNLHVGIEECNLTHNDLIEFKNTIIDKNNKSTKLISISSPEATEIINMQLDHTSTRIVSDYFIDSNKLIIGIKTKTTYRSLVGTVNFLLPKIHSFFGQSCRNYKDLVISLNFSFLNSFGEEIENPYLDIFKKFNKKIINIQYEPEIDTTVTIRNQGISIYSKDFLRMQNVVRKEFSFLSFK